MDKKAPERSGALGRLRHPPFIDLILMLQRGAVHCLHTYAPVAEARKLAPDTNRIAPITIRRMPGQFVPSPKNLMLRRGGSRVSRTGREAFGPLSRTFLLPARRLAKLRSRQIKPGDRYCRFHRCCSSQKRNHRVRVFLILESQNESRFGALDISHRPLDRRGLISINVTRKPAADRIYDTIVYAPITAGTLNMTFEGTWRAAKSIAKCLSEMVVVAKAARIRNFAERLLGLDQ
jgi:hypothetical protein